MKKVLLTLICSLSLCSPSIAQQCEPGKSELFFASTLRYNNLIEEENILKTGCIKVTKKSSLMIVNQVQTLESALLIEKYIPNIEFKNLKGLNNADWLSNILIKDLFKSRFSKVLEEEEKETQDLINQKFGMNKFDYQWKPKFEDTEKLLNYVGQKYKKEYAFYKDEYDNFALIYIVLSNRPELINYSYSAYDDKSIWIKVNKDKYSPLHFMFSPLLKGKDVTRLNDKVLKEVPVSYIINVPTLSLLDGKVYDYFQFAELMKENNPDLYKKLKDKYKFQIKSLYNTPEILKTMSNSLILNQMNN